MLVDGAEPQSQVVALGALLREAEPGRSSTARSPGPLHDQRAKQGSGGAVAAAEAVARIVTMVNNVMVAATVSPQQ
ncbi:hypothetical protein ACIBP6_07120 [Nonomuraea terrae]|uniref:hypothetical protein n=1 Tax=Nonomuraea terrae TaxID=2530383 RepID=UPI0037AEC315